MKSFHEVLLAIDIEQSSEEFLLFFTDCIYLGDDSNKFFETQKSNQAIKFFNNEVPLIMFAAIHDYDLSSEQDPKDQNRRSLSMMRLKPDILFEFENLPIMPIELEVRLQSQKQLKQTWQYLDYCVQILKHRIGHDDLGLCRAMQYFHSMCVCLSMSESFAENQVTINLTNFV